MKATNRAYLAFQCAILKFNNELTPSFTCVLSWQIVGKKFHQEDLESAPKKKSREEKKATDRLGHNSWHFGGCHGCCGTSLHTFVQQAVWLIMLWIMWPSTNSAPSIGNPLVPKICSISMLPLFFWEFLPVSIINKHNTQEFLVRSKRTKNVYKEPVTRRSMASQIKTQ